MYKLNVCKILMLVSIATQGFSATSRVIKSEDFLKILNNSMKQKTSITGKNNGPNGQGCLVEVKKGQGRSLNFQTTLEITENDILGKPKIPLSFNILNGVTGYYTEENGYESFQYELNGMKYEIIVFTDKTHGFGLSMQAKIGSMSRSAYCYVAKL